LDLSPEDVKLIREAIRELASVADEVVISTHKRPAVVGSPAHEYFSRAVEIHSESGLALITHAFGGSIIAILAAADHMKALVAAFNTRQVSVATATLTRGVVEALAKARYLLNAAGAEQLAQRYVALTRTEIEQAKKHNEFQSFAGEAVDGAEHLAKEQALLADMRLPEIGTVQLTNLATDLLEAVGGSGLGRRVYSQLSSIAHGESAGVAMHLRDSADGPRLKVPRDLALEYVATTAVACKSVVDRAVLVYRPDPLYVRRWNDAKDRSQLALEALLHT
jgi:hypothetical protein